MDDDDVHDWGAVLRLIDDGNPGIWKAVLHLSLQIGCDLYEILGPHGDETG